MIAHLKGTLLKKTPGSIIVDICGVGFEVIAPLSTFYCLPAEDETVSLHIYTHVREDVLLLFGFHSSIEKEIFKLLISVSGIGPKLAVNILSGIGPDELLKAIVTGDSARLNAIPGVGRKTSERIALELKEKASKITADIDLPPAQAACDADKIIFDDALSALLNLGYSQKPARQAVEKAFSSIKEKNLEGLIKEALKLLA
ncbi:MAG: Holliday junction branch migration protein RuvA [Deltaproteobacteria bacterium]|nr:Holliday junction branch migration protein RuvA [Deltaproteobacteria bacterium]